MWILCCRWRTATSISKILRSTFSVNIHDLIDSKLEYCEVHCTDVGMSVVKSQELPDWIPSGSPVSQIFIEKQTDQQLEACRFTGTNLLLNCFSLFIVIPHIYQQIEGRQQINTANAIKVSCLTWSWVQGTSLANRNHRVKQKKNSV